MQAVFKSGTLQICGSFGIFMHVNTYKHSKKGSLVSKSQQTRFSRNISFNNIIFTLFVLTQVDSQTSLSNFSLDLQQRHMMSFGVARVQVRLESRSCVNDWLKAIGHPCHNYTVSTNGVFSSRRQIFHNIRFVCKALHIKINTEK